MARAPSLWWPSIGQCALQLARTLYHTLHMLLFLVPFRRGGKKRRKYPAGVKKKTVEDDPGGSQRPTTRAAPVQLCSRSIDRVTGEAKGEKKKKVV